MIVYLKTFSAITPFNDYEDIVMGILDEETYKKDRLSYLNQALEEKAERITSLKLELEIFKEMQEKDLMYRTCVSQTEAEIRHLQSMPDEEYLGDFLYNAGVAYVPYEVNHSCYTLEELLHINVVP